MDATLELEASTIPQRLGDHLGSAPALPRQAPTWQAVALAYLAEAGQRTGSTRTPAEYGR